MERSERQGDSSLPDQLVTTLYEELRRLARARMAKLPPGNTLQPTALVHEVWLRLSRDAEAHWDGEAHFFGAAAQAMRQILVDQARRKSRHRHGGRQQRVGIDEVDLPVEIDVDELLALDQSLRRLERVDSRKAQIVLLRYFAGFERDEVAKLLNVSVRTVDREWSYIVARFRREMAGNRNHGS